MRKKEIKAQKQELLYKSTRENHKSTCDEFDLQTKVDAKFFEQQLSNVLNFKKSGVREIGIKEKSLSGKFNSTKNNRVVHFESSLERDFILQVEFDPIVIEYKEQPLKIKYVFENNEHYYVPDILVHFHNSAHSDFLSEYILFEIKYQKDIFSSEVDNCKFHAAKNLCKSLGWEFKVLTEFEIRTPYLQNARFLLYYRNYEYDNYADFELLHSTLINLDHTTPEELILVAARDKNKQAELIYLLWYMVANGYVLCDLSQQINMKTEIWANHNYFV